jgi:hypothetical protein
LLSCKKIIVLEQDYKIGTVFVGVLIGRGRVNGGDKDEGVGLMGFIYIKEID